MLPVLLVMAALPVHRYALVVGSNTGEGVRAAPLRFADDDAIAIHELLLEAGVESVLLTTPDADTARLHKDTRPLAPATLDALRGAFAAQRASMVRAQEAGETVEWLFFFSGHGDVESGLGFLGLETGKLTRAVLHDDLLARVPAVYSHVILDACRSGALVGSKGPGGLRLPMPAAFAMDPAWPANTGFVLSSSAAKDSHEWERLGAGVFSYEVRSALRGAADADADGAVSYAELGAFLETANGAIENARLRPEFLTIPPRGKPGLPISVLSWPTRGVETAVTEHAYLERVNGERLLDVHSGAGLKALLHLPVERPLFFRSADEQREFELTAETTQVASLEVMTRAMRQKGAVDRALERLFSVPFDAAIVERYQGAWQAPELKAFEVPGAPRAVLTGRSVAAWSAVGGLAIAASGFVFAWQQQREPSGLDQQMRAMRNTLVSAGNGAGVGGLVVAGLSTAVWVALTTLFELPLFNPSVGSP